MIIADWLREHYINQGKLGDAGRLHTMQSAAAPPATEKGIYLLDIGLGSNNTDLRKMSTAGRILRLDPSTKELTTLVTGQSHPDGIDISQSTSRIFWTNMGKTPPFLPRGRSTPPSSLVVDDGSARVYFCDREGMSVHRVDFSGSNHEVLVRTGSPSSPEDSNDTTRWCVGIALDTVHGYIYWTQKGPSKGGQGRIFRAGIDIPAGQTAETRSDIELVLEKLPEPIDLELDVEEQVLYWTDRGEHPTGCSLNRVDVSGNIQVGEMQKKKTILARQFHEPIGLKLDREKRVVYVGDMGGIITNEIGKMQIIWRDSANPAVYEAARVRGVFNRRCPSKFPRAIVKASSEEDVISAIQLATSHDCRIAVRAGGHSFPVWSLQDDSVLIDLGEWRECVVDGAKRTASVTPGVTSKEVNDILVPQGLMFPAGHCPDVGLGGFLLQGGMGWNCGNWGWACERVDAVEVVTAQGVKLLCNAEQNSDLYWAARGAGPGYVYPAPLYRPVFSWVLSMVPDLDQDTEVTALSQFFNGELCFSVFLVCMKKTTGQAAEALQTLHDTRIPGALTEWFCREDSLESLYREKAKSNPQGHRWCSDSTYLETKDVVDILEEGFLTLPSTDCYAFWCPITPTSKRKLPDMAFSMQSDHYFAVYAGWEDEPDDQRCQSWLQLVMNKIKPHGVGAYIGDSDFCVLPDRYWTQDNESRLKKIRQRWDPDSRLCGFP
ncbi:uncharacterized protein CDV56_100980 [Aspergillus thermomutatus]|uniref:FAD-binding PCMH-type domain-containing protein n=1 Tax=Aspergillus thermomutatus TaxID=41047 RepID=A0A397FZU5_ASPTH|nr:uncharacterized protein CDV56_100980 [Aspergillus thermomutatus]RHZ44291.1 hypothetical protein CDV56_100980 [Aspergillus thermomutatus]